MPRLHLPQMAKAAPTATGNAGMQASAANQETDFVSQILHVRELTDDPLLRKWFSTLPSVASPAPSMNMDAVLDSMPLDLPTSREHITRLQSERKRVAVERARRSPFWREKLHVSFTAYDGRATHQLYARLGPGLSVEGVSQGPGSWTDVGLVAHLPGGFRQVSNQWDE